VERQERRLIDRLTGTGSITRAGESLGAVKYYIEVWQEFIITKGFGPDPEREHPGLKELRIRLIESKLDTFKLLSEPVTLHLEDGRHVDCFFDGNHFVPSGPLTG
jgi:hypothetical protein